MIVSVSLCVFFPILAAIIAYPLNKKNSKVCDKVVILSTFSVLLSAVVMSFADIENSVSIFLG